MPAMPTPFRLGRLKMRKKYWFCFTWLLIISSHMRINIIEKSKKYKRMTISGYFIAAGLLAMTMLLGGCKAVDDIKNTHTSDTTMKELKTEVPRVEISDDKPASSDFSGKNKADNAETSIDDSFYISPITDEIFARIDGKSFKKDCTLSREDLRYIHVLHKDIDGNEHEGEMIVNMHIADDVLDIMKQLYEADYPIEKIRLVDEYNADDETSMEDNNSSAFNFRFISGTKKVSKHGFGLAVDINTLYNPYFKIVNGKRILEPITAEPYLDREADFPYKIEENDLCYKLFTEKGFVWGGSWKNRKDYQHFEIPDEIIAKWYPEFVL